MDHPKLDPALVPNLFVIGAAKAGTTSFHRYLSQHPDVLGANPKEPWFFADPGHVAKIWPERARDPVSHDPDAYLALFAGRTARYRFEASVGYTELPHETGAAARIAGASPHARLIYMVRDPVERTISHYWQRRKGMLEQRSMDEAIVPGSLYVDTSRYAYQLRPYLELFDRSQIMVIGQEELRENGEDMFERVFAWLDLPPIPMADILREKANVTPDTTKVQRFPLARALRDSAAWQSLRGVLPSGMIDATRSLAVRERPRASFDDRASREWLAQYFRQEAGELDALMGTKLERRWFPDLVPADS